MGVCVWGGVLFKRGRQIGVLPVKTLFCRYIDFYSVKTIAGRYGLVAHITSTDDGLFRFVNIDNLERP